MITRANARGLLVGARAASAVVLGLFLASASAACGGGTAARGGAPAPAASSTPTAPDVVHAMALASAAPACTEPTQDVASQSATARERAIDALLRGDAREADALLAETVRADPRDRAAEAFRRLSRAKRASAREALESAVERAASVPLEALPLARSLRHPAPADVEAPKVKLEKVSEQKNLVTDEAAWERQNEVAPAWSRAELVEAAPEAQGVLQARGAWGHVDHVVTSYDSHLLVSADGKRPRVFDVRAALAGPRRLDVAFAQLVGETLLLALAYNGYAKESGGKNGYLAAFDAKTGALAWSTEALVANVGEAVVTGNAVVTGYGFTSEPDFLFVIDLATGAVEQKLPVKSGPSALRVKGERLFVRTYDTDYVFRSPTGFSAARPAALEPDGREAKAAVTADARCWVRRATAAILAREVAALHDASTALREHAVDPAVLRLVQEEEERLRRGGELDLTVAPLVVVAPPPWEAYSARSAPPRKSARPPRLVKVASRAASPVRHMDRAPEPGRAIFLAPVDRGRKAGVPAEIPSSYGLEHLSAVLRAADGTTRLLVYGGRYLAVVRGETAERVFDLDAFRHPPKANPQWAEFAIQDLTFAEEREGILYLCNGGGSYAKEVYGKKGFLSALDATTGKLVWRSRPLVCNAELVIAGEHLVTGYGFTAEPDFVHLVRLHDGVVVESVPIGSGPQAISLDGNRVHVEAYGHELDLELRVAPEPHIAQ